VHEEHWEAIELGERSCEQQRPTALEIGQCDLQLRDRARRDEIRLCLIYLLLIADAASFRAREDADELRIARERRHHLRRQLRLRNNIRCSVIDNITRRRGVTLDLRQPGDVGWRLPAVDELRNTLGEVLKESSPLRRRDRRGGSTEQRNGGAVASWTQRPNEVRDECGCVRASVRGGRREDVNPKSRDTAGEEEAADDSEEGGV
jgi:hypothetical protein